MVCAKRVLVLPVAMLALVFSAGCGRDDVELASVTGKITLDGEPLGDAFVVFSPVNGGTTSYGRSDSSGYYEMMFSDDDKGAWRGVNRVEISTGDVGVSESGGAREKVPVAYNKESTLTANVEQKANTFDFVLNSSGSVEETMVEAQD